MTPSGTSTHWQRRLPLLTRLLVVAVVATVGWAAAPTAATTVKGSLRYAGLPVVSTFTNLKSCVVYCFSSASQASNTYSVDPTSGTYVVPVDLAPGQYVLHFLMSRTPGRTDVYPVSGELWGAAVVNVPSTTPFVVDVDLAYAVHILAPFDSLAAWNGTKDQCPFGPQTPVNFTLAWQAVPNAARYLVQLQHWDCTHQISAETMPAATTSLEVVQHQIPGELYLAVRVDALDETGRTISMNPMVVYNDGKKGNLYFRAATGSGRPVHDATAHFLYQAGHKQGSAGTFWKTDLTLTNPTTSPITADLYYTPRDADGTVIYTHAQVDLKAQSSRNFADAVDSLFHVTGYGSIEVMPGVVEVLSRNYTPAPNPPGGFYGQGYPPVAADATASSDGATTLLGSGFVIKGTHRTNLTLVEVWGESAHVRVRLLDRNGNDLGTGPVGYDVPPLGNIQVNDLGTTFGVASLSEGQVTVEVLSGEGRVAGCLSVVDSVSQDPSTLPLVRRF